MKRMLLIAMVAFSGNVFSEEILQSECTSCHNISGPVAQTLKEAFAKKAPDLSYAGNKYRQEWLVTWLQKPARIRPAGMYYGDHIKPGSKNDEIIPSTLAEHAALTQDKAIAIAAELMKLKAHDDLIAQEKIEPGSIDKTMGEMNFDKFWGCLACHQIEPDYGGVSGPELYSAAKRLQPAFIASFIRNPQAWEPKTWMPNKGVSNGGIQKMVYYLETLSKEAANVQ